MRRVLMLAWALAAGCAHGKGGEAVCPEYRERFCLAQRDCALDRSRGCLVCECHQDDRTREQRGLPPPEARGVPEPQPLR